MTDNSKFTASIANWEKKTLALQRKIAVASVLDVINDAQKPVAKSGFMPVDTGNLRNSITMELNASEVSKGNGDEPSGDTAIILAITKFEIGDIIAINWTAPYAMRINYGFSGEDSLGRTYNYTGTMFRDKAAAKWQNIVSKNARAAR